MTSRTEDDGVMGKLVRKSAVSEETLREVADLLYGGGASELVSKLSDRDKRRATAGLSTVGASAGALGLAVGVKELRHHGWAKTPKLTRALIPAEIAGLGGEIAATKILHNDAKKMPKPGQPPKPQIAKSEPGSADVHSLSAGKLKRVAATKAMGTARPYLQQVEVESNKKLKNTFKKSDQMDILWEGEFSKVDADKRQVFGWASIVEKDGEPVYDLQGDYIDSEEIEKSAYDYVIKSRKGGDMHRRNPDDTPVHSSDMIESFMVTPEKIAKMGLPEGSLPTGWWVGFQVNDDDAWNLVKSGKRTAFSIHGRGNRTPMED